jgi:four helix bundle protein
MKENIIKTKSFQFSLIIIELYKFLCAEKKEFVMSKQILRSGTAIGALVAESEHAQSKMDFVNKLAIAQKEANETAYWLELLFVSEYLDDREKHKNIKSDLQEIQKILASIIITTKKNHKK